MRSPLSSRTNKRPTAVSALDEELDCGPEFTCSLVTIFSFPFFEDRTKFHPMKPSPTGSPQAPELARPIHGLAPGSRTGGSLRSMSPRDDLSQGGSLSDAPS